ncbi:MAG: hypothetical protein ABI765_06730 [Gemmatimonadota bacterium]
MRIRLLTGALLLAACGGGAGPAAVAPQGAAAATPEAAVRAFLQAATDSNIARMSMLWGTEKGPAFKTHQPSEYMKRLEVIQIYLRDIKYTVGNIHPASDDASKQVVEVIIDRSSCHRTMPVTAAQSSRDGWVVYQFDLNTAGSPQRPCRDAGADQIQPKH